MAIPTGSPPSTPTGVPREGFDARQAARLQSFQPMAMAMVRLVEKAGRKKIQTCGKVVCMYVCMDGWMDGWMDGLMDGCIYVCMYVSM